MQNNQTLFEAIELIKKSEEIIVFSGAGISTKSGILDFRSSDGLYNHISSNYDLPYPEAIFELDYFIENPKPFYNLAMGILDQYIRPTKCHEFLAWLEEQGKQIKIITQNSDMLHQVAGSQDIMECHGTFNSAHCLECESEFHLDDIRDTILEGTVPYCDCGGLIKPDVVFFGEDLPEEVYSYFEKEVEADLILILGTSLNVLPISKFITEILERIPSIMVNLEATQYDKEVTCLFNEDLNEFAELSWGLLEKSL